MHKFNFLWFVLLTVLCWGVYGPVVLEGQIGLGTEARPSSLRAFLFVGTAYFLVAVLFPALFLHRERGGAWTAKGISWSLAAGLIGATGALGLILTFMFGGSPVYAMPLVFGCAPVVNTLATMVIARTIGQASIAFYLGVIVVAVGGAGVMFFKPTVAIGGETSAGAVSQSSQAAAVVEGEHSAATRSSQSSKSVPLMVASMALTALCWGSYGPVLHKGREHMGGSRLRPFLFVGVAYFLVAVAMPTLILQISPPEPGQLTFDGITWSLLAGVAGAVGALGVICAFNSGGKPILVMPLVFGGAPVVNTLWAVFAGGKATLPFLASLALVVFGTITVIVCAPERQNASANKAQFDG